jgi:hypothetical protein
MTDYDEIWVEIGLLKEQLQNLQIKREAIIKAHAEFKAIADNLEKEAERARAAVSEVETALEGGETE